MQERTIHYKRNKEEKVREEYYCEEHGIWTDKRFGCGWCNFKRNKMIKESRIVQDQKQLF